MNPVFASCLALSLIAAGAAVAQPQDLGGRWTLRIRDLSHKEVSKLTIRFTEKLGTSCTGGNWKQVLVESAETSDPRFFPIADALTYELDESELTIGRNGICDAYLRLQGKLDGSRAEGPYYAFGLRGGTDLGEFSLSRDR